MNANAIRGYASFIVCLAYVANVTVKTLALFIARVSEILTAYTKDTVFIFKNPINFLYNICIDLVSHSLNSSLGKKS